MTTTTFLLHEIGEFLGLEHSLSGKGVMASSLEPGVRASAGQPLMARLGLRR